MNRKILQAEEQKGTILVVTLWVILILAMLAVSISYRIGIEVKLVRFYLYNIKSLYIARAGFLSAAALKAEEIKSGRSWGIDALSQDWANNPKVFKKAPFGGGAFTIGQLFFDKSSGEQLPFLYGMEDETGKININKASREILKNLLMQFVRDEEEALALAAAICDWRDEDKDPQTDGGRFIGIEDYKSEGFAYDSKNKPFDCLEELLLVKGITPEIFYGCDKDKDGILSCDEAGIRGFLTIYGNGKSNINTASHRVLRAIVGEGFSALADKIAEYRAGMDAVIGTDDDRWFAKGAFVIDRQTKGLVEVKDLGQPYASDPIFGVSTDEWKRLVSLTTGDDGIISVVSSIYRTNIRTDVDGILKDYEVVFQITADKEPQVFYWHES